MSSIKTFLGMLEEGTDNVLLRYSLGNAYYQDKQFNDAILHLLKATEQDPLYSAAWKALGRCYFDLEDYRKAAEVYERGIKVAADKGDRQAEKEMTVFLRRSRKKIDFKS